jgi:hypothetical protein
MQCHERCFLHQRTLRGARLHTLGQQLERSFHPPLLGAVAGQAQIGRPVAGLGGDCGPVGNGRELGVAARPGQGLDNSIATAQAHVAGLAQSYEALVRAGPEQVGTREGLDRGPVPVQQRRVRPR